MRSHSSILRARRERVLENLRQEHRDVESRFLASPRRSQRWKAKQLALLKDLRIRIDAISNLPPITDPDEEPVKTRQSISGFTLIEMLIILIIIGVLVALLLPSVQSAREASRRMQCQNNLKQIGLALANFEAARGYIPNGGGSTNWSVTPPMTQFTDGSWSTLAQLLPFMEQQALFNQTNFSIEPNDQNGGNDDVICTAIPSFLCPSVSRVPGGTNSGMDIHNQNFLTTHKQGAAYTDYGSVFACDIDPTGGISGPGSTPIVPYRNTGFRVDGALTHGKNRIGSVTDGLSNTLFIGEVAGRDPRQVSEWAEGYLDSVNGRIPLGAGPAVNPAGTMANVPRRMWAWYECASGIVVSGTPNNRGTPARENGPWSLEPGQQNTSGNNAQQNDELYSFHPGGVNILLGDGSVHLLTDKVNQVVLRCLITPASGEPLSLSDAF